MKILVGLFSRGKAAKMNPLLLSGYRVRRYLIAVFVACRMALRFAVLCLWSSFAAASDPLLTNPRFSWDERFVALDYCDPQCKIVISSLESGESTMLSPEGDTWINPSFDPLSDRILFIRSRTAGAAKVDVQVATSKRDGSQFSLLTDTPTVKRHPSYSFDGKQIIFWAKEPNPSKEGPRFLLADAYSIDLQTRSERRLTDLRLIDMSAPFFMADGRHITFSTSGSARPRAGAPGSIPLDKLYPNRTMFVVPVDRSQALTPFVSKTPTASAPMPLQDGSLAFLVRVNEYDGVKEGFAHDIFIVKGNEIRRHTMFRDYVRTYGISRTGRYIAFATGNSRSGSKGRIVIWDSHSGQGQVLNLGKLAVLRISNRQAAHQSHLASANGRN